MAQAAYKKQAALLLSVLPEVAKETCFALHGGTAINLFYRSCFYRTRNTLGYSLVLQSNKKFSSLDALATSFCNRARAPVYQGNRARGPL